MHVRSDRADIQDDRALKVCWGDIVVSHISSTRPARRGEPQTLSSFNELMGKVDRAAVVFKSYFDTITELKDRLALVVEDRVGKPKYNVGSLNEAWIALDETRDLVESTGQTGTRYYADVSTNFNPETQRVEDTEQSDKSIRNSKAGLKEILTDIFLELSLFHPEIVGEYDLDDDNSAFLKDVNAILKITPEYNTISCVGQTLIRIMQEDQVPVQWPLF